jgi:FKBP-type peptidyl-prolyl cis-trans isomerase FkpA
MAEVTRVPLQPTSRGSRTLLVFGILVALLIAGGFAWLTAPQGVTVEEVRAGTGEHPKDTDVIFVNYTGKLADGTVFDKSQPMNLPVQGILPDGTPLPLENMVPGFKEAAVRMQRGGKYVVHIPAEKAYGREGRMNPQTGEGVPPNADLTFEIELVDFLPMEEVERRFQVLQQMMAQQQAPGAEGGAAPAPAPAAPPAGQ